VAIATKQRKTIQKDLERKAGKQTGLETKHENSRQENRFRSWLSRRLRPPRRLRITREGKVFIGVALGVGFAAINTGNNLLYLVLGLLLSIIILSGLLSEMALRGLEFRRKLPKRTFAGTAMLVEIEVKNTKRFSPSYSIEVEDRIDNRRTDKRCYFLKVAAGARQTAAYRRTPPARGRERYAALRVATRFPFGLFEKWREIEIVEEQWVYPAPKRTVKVMDSVVSFGDIVPRNGLGRGEIDGLRELRQGEPVRDIDWKKTASLARPIARERKKDGIQHLRIEIMNKMPEDQNSEKVTEKNQQRIQEFAKRVDESIGKAAWVALESLKEGAVVEISAQDAGDGQATTLIVSPSGSAVDKILAFLARLPPEPPIEESVS